MNDMMGPVMGYGMPAMEPARKESSQRRRGSSIEKQAHLLVRRAPAELRDQVNVAKDGLLRGKGTDTFAEVRARALVLGTGEVIDLDDAVVERTRKRDSLKVKDIQGDNALRLKFADKEAADNWFVKLTEPTERISLADFEVLSPVGKGGMGSVFLVRHKETAELCAMKVLPRFTIVESERAMRRALDERLSLEKVTGHPFFVQLKYAFQTENNLYMVTDFCAGGDLHDYLLAHNYRLKENVVKRFFAEIVTGLETLHNMGIVYRDLKPENVLLDYNGHVKITDLGLAKTLEAGRLGRTYSFCGTKKFMAPEVYNRMGHGTAADLWSLGVLLYSLLTGSTPYSDPSAFDINEHTFPSSVTAEAESLIRSLLTREADRATIADVKVHPWLASIKWETLVDEATLPQPEVWEQWQLDVLHAGKFLHTKAEKLSGLTIGDDDSASSFRKNSGPLRMVKRGSKVNLIPGYVYVSGSSRSSQSTSVVSHDL